LSAGSPQGIVPAHALPDLPKKLRAELLGAFNEIVVNFAAQRWEPAELNGGKLCEVTYNVLRGYVDGRYPAKSTKPRNMVAACTALEQAPTGSIPRSIRIQIPRMLIALYEVRNNRNVGHVGGDVDPSHMDAVCVLQMAKWILAELIRALHDLSVEEATALVDALVERDTPLVWLVGGKKRVLATGLSMREKALILLHATVGPVNEQELVSWLEHSNASVFRRDVIRRVHAERLWEYDADARTIALSPLGIAAAEILVRAHQPPLAGS
jgi:hypothetical protein